MIDVNMRGAHRASPTAVVYCAIKFAFRAPSQGLRQENTDARVTSISPVVVDSELAESKIELASRELMNESRASAPIEADSH